MYAQSQACSAPTYLSAPTPSPSNDRPTAATNHRSINRPNDPRNGQQESPETAVGGVGGSEMDVSSPSSPSSPISAGGDGSFSFIWASERSGFMHLYLYKYVPGAPEAVEVRQITSGEWVVEFVVGVDQVSFFFCQ